MLVRGDLILLQYKIDNVAEQYQQIARRVERDIRDGRRPPGSRLPTVRGLAAELGVSPATVSAAYRVLGARGLVTGRGRRGTQVAAAPPLAVRRELAVPPGVRDLAGGNPDPALLPAFPPLAARSTLYGEPTKLAELVELGGSLLEADGVAADALAVVAGALDGLERVLAAHLRPGDSVAVEDPGFARIYDLVSALGLSPVPVGVDDLGPRPEELEEALARGVEALIVTPRAQNPTGAALDESRARELRAVLDRRPDVLVIEDDHAAEVSGATAETLTAGRGRWAVARSLSKGLGPDLRVALLAGDETTVSRVEGRQLLGTGWVSHVLQRLGAALLAHRQPLERAARIYGERRGALLDALAARGIEAHGRSGLNVWVPVPDEAAVVRGLLDAGWAVAAGERFRIASAPAVRITIATLRPEEAEVLAANVEAALAPRAASIPSS
jgi:DNA-binding transcriptional MocR family regulator